MARKPEGPPPPPPVQKLRLHYAKRGRLRFSSHRDFQRAFERALRRAGVPMAYSAGFSPHPKVSYANAAPTGTASEAEYLEISVVERLDPAAVRAALDASLPPDLDVVDVVEAGPGSLADRLQASVWELRLVGVPPQVAQEAVERFLAAEAVEVTRLTKNGMRTFDARSAVVAAVIDVADVGTPSATDGAPTGGASPEGAAEGYAILRMVVRHATPAVRPDDVLTGLRLVADLAPPSPPQVTRLAQGPLDETTGTVADPLDPDRGVVGAR
jgi:radical SAM-linked protein